MNPDYQIVAYHYPTLSGILEEVEAGQHVGALGRALVPKARALPDLDSRLQFLSTPTTAKSRSGTLPIIYVVVAEHHVEIVFERIRL